MIRVILCMVLVALLAFNAGRTYEYVQGYAVKAEAVDGMIQQGLEGCNK